MDMGTLEDYLMLTKNQKQSNVHQWEITSTGIAIWWKSRQILNILYVNIHNHIKFLGVSLVAPMQETWVRSLGWEDPQGEGVATHSSILALKIPMDRGTRQATVHGVAELDTTERLSTA